MADADAEVPKEKKPRRPREAALPNTPDPVEIAMKALATGADRHGAAQAVLEKHAKLIDRQAELAQAQVGLARDERVRNRVRFARDGGVALLVLTFVLAIGWAVASAAGSRAIVVQAFSVPPELARRGLTGEVVAQRFLDQLLDVQSKADSARTPASFADSWSGDLKVQIPSTGVSLGEVHRMLRSSLGQETYLTGEVLAEGSTLRVSARSAGQAPVEVTAGADQLDMLLRSAAEGVFGRHQPYLYAVYLQEQSGRGEEAVEVLRKLARSGPPSERAWAYNGWGNYLRRSGRASEAPALYRAAIALDPTIPLPYLNLGVVHFRNGREGHAAAAIADLEPRYRKKSAAGELKAEAVDSFLVTRTILTNDLAADHAGMEAAGLRALQMLDYNASVPSAPAWLAAAQASLHRTGQARATLAADPPGAESRMRLSMPLTVVEHWSLARLKLGAMEGDWTAVLREAEELERWHSGEGANLAANVTVIARPWMARARAELGDLAGAARIAAGTPLDCTLCLRTRGHIAALSGRPQESNRWFAAAVRTAPQLPLSYQEWAERRLARGDLRGAAGLAASAAKRGPRWADPVKLTGDVLQRQGRRREALSAYGDAAERAPRWGALHLAWGQALWRAGKQDEARQKFRAAQTMDMSASERERLHRISRT